MKELQVTTNDGIPVGTVTIGEDGWLHWKFTNGTTYHQRPRQVCQNTLVREQNER